MAKTKFQLHLEALCKELRCLSDVNEDPDFISDLDMLRSTYKELYKLMNDKRLYPHPPAAKFNLRETNIHKCRKVIVDICLERNIKFEWFTCGGWEHKNLNMVARFTRKETTLNALLDF